MIMSNKGKLSFTNLNNNNNNNNNNNGAWMVFVLI